MNILLPTTVIKRSQQAGLTLLETVLALAVGTVIIMAVLIYFQTASDNANMTATIKITSDIGNAVRTYAQSPSYKPGTITLTQLQAMGLLTAADTVNPWSIRPKALAVSTSGNYLGINFNFVPAKTNSASTTPSQAGGICMSLATQLSNSLPIPSPGTVTLTFNDGSSKTYTFVNPSTGGLTGTGPGGKSKTSQGAAVCQYTKGNTTGTLSIVMDLS